MIPPFLVRLLTLAATYGPKGMIGALGYALLLLAAASFAIGELAASGQIHIADCSGAAFDATMQTVGIGQASAAILVLLVGIVQQAKTIPAAELAPAPAEEPPPIPAPPADDGGAP